MLQPNYLSPNYLYEYLHKTELQLKSQIIKDKLQIITKIQFSENHFKFKHLKIDH
jgi:hypothetical protein